jgi:CRP-like cAMP-binding protein
MSGKFIKLYESGTAADCSFLLEEGNAFFFVTTSDKYILNGRNLIIGGSELILFKELGISASRMETALVDETSKVKKISSEKFSEGMSNFPFLINVSMVLAKQVSLTNKIITENRKNLVGKEDDRRTLCIDYYKIVRDLRDENVKRKLPWLKDIVVKYETSLVFKEGEALSRTSEPVKIMTSNVLTSKMVEYPKDGIICEEGADGTEMYILQSGMIDVLVGGKPVATISDPGTPIGEIALLIGEKRTATMKAKNTVVLTRIHKNDLKDIAVNDLPVIKSIALSLAKKHYQNVSKVHDLTMKLVEKQMNTSQEDNRKAAMKYSSIASSLSSLRNDISEVLFKKNEPFLREIAVRYNIT